MYPLFEYASCKATTDVRGGIHDLSHRVWFEGFAHSKNILEMTLTACTFQLKDVSLALSIAKLCEKAHDVGWVKGRRSV
jgi:hypothetical protein